MMWCHILSRLLNCRLEDIPMYFLMHNGKHADKKFKYFTKMLA